MLATVAPGSLCALWCNMIYRANIWLRGEGNTSDIATFRQGVAHLIEKHGGKNGTPNPRNHVVGIFTDKAAMKVFRTEARAALSA